MMRMGRRLIRKQRGQTMVEIAMIMPLLLLLILGTLDFGVGMYQYNTVSNTAREAARYASAREHEPLSYSDLTGGASNPRSTAAAIDAARKRAVSLDQSRLTITVTPGDWVQRSTVGATVTAQVSFVYQPVTPFVPFSVTMHSEAQMIIE